MNIYKTHKTSRVVISALAFVPIALGLFLIVTTLIAYSGGMSAIVFNLTALGCLFLYFGYLLFKSAFVTATLNSNELRVKMLFTPVKIYKLKELKEVVLYQLRPINEITLHELSGVAETYGRSMSL